MAITPPSARQWLIPIALAAPACQAAAPPSAQPQTPPPAVLVPPRPPEPLPSTTPATSATAVAAPSTPPPSGPEPSSAPLAPGARGACGRKPGERIERVSWAHGSGNAKCDALETLWANVPHADRACRSDDECTIISSDGNCIRLPLTKIAARRAEYQTPPCGNPMSGACPADHVPPRCIDGCCVAK